MAAGLSAIAIVATYGWNPELVRSTLTSPRALVFIAVVVAAVVGVGRVVGPRMPRLARATQAGLVDEATSAALVDKLHLTFPVAYGVDADQVAHTLGSYLHDDPRYLESTGFVLGPEGTVKTAVYSSNAIGRLLPDDVVGMVSYAKQRA